MQYNKENIKMPNVTQEDNSQELFYTKQHKNCVQISPQKNKIMAFIETEQLARKTANDNIIMEQVNTFHTLVLTFHTKKNFCNNLFYKQWD